MSAFNLLLRGIIPSVAAIGIASLQVAVEQFEIGHHFVVAFAACRIHHFLLVPFVEADAVRPIVAGIALPVAVDVVEIGRAVGQGVAMENREHIIIVSGSFRDASPCLG